MRSTGPIPMANSMPQSDAPIPLLLNPRIPIGADTSRWLGVNSTRPLMHSGARPIAPLVHYLQELTLAETGPLLGEHESTVSRGLARTRMKIRRSAERALRKDNRLSDDQINRCFEYAVKRFAV